MNKFFFVGLIILLSVTSCRVNPGRMFQTPSGYQFAQPADSANNDIGKIEIHDRLDLHIFSNDGFKLVDITASNLSQSVSSEGITYIVENNGEVKLPVIGRIMLKGLSLKEAEDLLQEKYTKYYHDPFVILRIVSHQALVFISDAGRGVAINLMNEHTTLFEALALAGGIGTGSRSFNIKILRGDMKNPQVFLADASTIEGLKNSELQIHPNDIIYVDSGSGLRKLISTEIIPYLSILTSLFLVVTYLTTK